MSENQDLFQKAMNQGHSAAWEQAWDRAVEYYRLALEVIPDQPKALTSLGLAYYELGEYNKAFQYYSRAAAVSPDEPVPLEKIAQLSELLGNQDYVSKASLRAADLYLKKNEVEKAIENLSRVVRIDIEDLSAHSRLALIFERLDRRQQAVTEYLVVASLLQHKGEREKASQAILHAIQILPDSPEAQRAQAMLNDLKPLPKPSRSSTGTGPLHLPMARKSEPASIPNETETSLDPVAETKQKALAVLAGMLFDQADREEAEGRPAHRGLTAIVRGAPGSLFTKQVDKDKIMLHLSQAVDLQSQGQEEQVAVELEHAVEAGLEHAAAYFEIGMLRSQGTRLESALRSLQKSVNHTEYALGARLLLGETYRKMGRLPEAVLEYLEALKLADAQVVPADQVDELLQLYEPLIEIEARQKDTQAKERLCETISRLLMQNDWRKQLALSRLNLITDAKSGAPIPLGEVLGEVHGSQMIEAIINIHNLARAGHMRSALEEAFYALQFAPTYLPLHILMGELLFQQDHLPEAIEKFTTVARTYSARGEAGRAIQLLRRVIQLAPMDLAARARLIQLLIARGLVDEAVQGYLEMADVYYNLADLNMARQTYNDAMELTQAASLDSTLKIHILHQIADIELQSLDWRKALAHYEQIRALKPDNQRARVRLVELNMRLSQEEQAEKELVNYLVFLTESNQGGEIAALLEGLVSEHPDQIFIRRYLAEDYRQTGRRAEAIKQLDRVGEILIEKGDRLGAAQVIQTILALDPENKDDYRGRLAQLQG